MNETDKREEKKVPKYPEIEVALGDLSGPEGNAFVVLGRFQKALQQSIFVEPKDVDAIMAEAKSGDYAHLLSTVNEFVTATVTDFTVGKPLAEEIGVIAAFSATVAGLDEGVL